MRRKGVEGTVLIGRRILVLDARNPQLTGIEGEVVDETRNTLRLRTAMGDKTLIKDQLTIKVDDKVIQGNDIQGRIEERIKRSW